MKPNYRHTLTYNSTPPKVLDSAPGGWEEVTRTYKRSDLYHGVFFIDNSPQRFFKVNGNLDEGGYQYIIDAYEAEGIKAVIEYKRERLNTFTDDYEDDFTGLMQLTPKSGFTINITERFIEATIIDSGKIQSFTANDSKNISLDSTTAINGTAITAFVNSPIECSYPKIDIYLYALTTGGTDLIDRIVTIVESIDTFFSYSATFNYVGDRLGISGSADTYTNTTDEDIVLQFTAEGTYSGQFEYIVNDVSNFASVNQKLIAEIYDSDDILVETITYWEEADSRSSLPATYQHNYSGSFSDSRDITILAGGKMQFKCVTNTITLQNITMRYNLDTDYDPVNFIEYYEGADTSQELTWYPHELAQRAIQIMTGETDTSKLLYAEIFGRTDSEFQTYLVNGALSRIGSIGGRVLRRIKNSTTIINFRDWFKSIDMIGNIALYYEKTNDRFIIVEKESVYKDTEILDIGTVSNLSKTLDKKYYYSQLLTGMREKGEYEKIQGILEEHISSEHSISMPVNDKLDLRTPYNLDPIGIELQRRSKTGEDGLKDTKQDEKVFLTEFDETDVAITNEDIGGFDGYIGIEERYNGNYTVRKNILKQGNWLSSIFFKEPSTSGIKFETNTKDLNISYNGTFEQDFILKTELGTPLYYPEIYEFESTANYETITQLNADPHGYIKFNDENGDIYYGYILLAEIKEYKGKAKYKLLRANINR